MESDCDQCHTRAVPWRAALLAVVLCPLGAGCGGDSTSTHEVTVGPGPQHAAPVGRGAGVARCDTAALGKGRANWRESATSVGSVGIYGTGRDFRTAFRGGQRRPVTKAPVIVEGRQAVTLGIDPADRVRAGLVVVGDTHPYATVRFVPCRDRPRTWWPAGFKLADPAPVVVLVRRANASVVTLEVGRP